MTLALDAYQLLKQLRTVPAIILFSTAYTVQYARGMEAWFTPCMQMKAKFSCCDQIKFHEHVLKPGIAE